MPSLQSYRQKWWICYALRNGAFNACSTLRADDNGVKLTAMKCPFEWYQVWYMFTQKIVSKSHLNKGPLYEFRPIITLIGHDVIFSDYFSPPKHPFFSLKICNDIPRCNTQGTSWPDFWNWSRGPFKTPFCPLNLFYITCFDRIII